LLVKKHFRRFEVSLTTGGHHFEALLLKKVSLIAGEKQAKFWAGERSVYNNVCVTAVVLMHDQNTPCAS
jgi:hypothetical protein